LFITVRQRWIGSQAIEPNPTNNHKPHTRIHIVGAGLSKNQSKTPKLPNKNLPINVIIVILRFLGLMRVRDFYGIPSPQPSPKWGEGAAKNPVLGFPQVEDFFKTRDYAFCLLFWVASFSCRFVIKIWGELDLASKIEEVFLFA
jgi:hypothetical protein